MSGQSRATAGDRCETARGRARRVLLSSTAFGLAALLALAEAAPAHAQAAGASRQAVLAFDIPAQPLDAALARFGAATGIQVIYDSDISGALRSSSVAGRLTAAAALSRLLRSTGLTPRFTGERTVTLVRAGAQPVTVPAQAAGVIRLDEITVEGERVSRDYFRTYSSIGVVTGRDVTAYNIPSLQQSFGQLANVRQFPSTGGNNGFVIRGLNSEGVTQPSRSAPIVSVVIDGAIQNGEAVRRGARGVWDVEQIEVMRGPQSTLQGRNALGGSVIVNSRNPTWTPEVIVDGLVGGNEMRSGAFVLSGPIVPNQLAVRLSGQISRETRDIRFTDPAAARLARDEFHQIRGKVLFTPEAIPALTALFTVSHTFDHPGYGVVTGPDFYARRYATTPSSPVEFRQTRVNNYIADISYELAPGWVLKSVTGFAQTSTGISTPAGSLFDRTEQRSGGDFSQDLRLVFNPPGSPLSGVAGLFAGSFTNRANSLISTALLAPYGIPTASIQDATFDSRTTSIAAYADIRYRFLDRWTLIAGGRILRDTVANDVRGVALDQAATEFNIGFCMIMGCAPSAAYVSLNENVSSSNAVFLPKIGLAFDLASNQTLAATASRGYRSGFAELVAGTTTVNRIAPEFLWSYELAYRSRWLDDRLQVNANLFYYDYRNQQILVENPIVPGGTFTQNGGRSHAYGAEIEARWRPLEGLTLFSSLGLMRTRFDEAITDAGNLRGKRFPESPTLTFALGGIYRHHSGFFVGADMSYTDGFYSAGDLMNTSSRYLSSFVLVNAQVGYEMRHATITLFARNLLDKQYLTSKSAGGLDATIGDGRVVGIRGTARF